MDNDEKMLLMLVAEVVNMNRRTLHWSPAIEKQFAMTFSRVLDKTEKNWKCSDCGKEMK